MVELGGNPVLWHIMKIYSAHGLNDFIICLGYKGYLIKEFFANYFLHRSDVTIDLTAPTSWWPRTCWPMCRTSITSSPGCASC